MAYSGPRMEYPAVLQNNIKVKSVTGGSETNPAWVSKIGNQAFSAALEKSLASQGLQGEQARYHIEAMIVSQRQPLVGVDITVVTDVRYVLKDAANGSSVMTSEVLAQYKATVADAFVFNKRARLANEGSGQRSIAEFLTRLSRLSLAGPDTNVGNPTADAEATAE